ncbi:hypothetical protein PV341_40505 [Streptomyces sp. PA03-1a]|nr:hypothetical protein [Streptomyces sp. PA03-1a]
MLPELTGHELIDLLDADDPAPGRGSAARRQGVLFRSLVRTLGLRSTNSVTERTLRLLDVASARLKMSAEVLEATLSVAAQPGHRLNADQLHRILLRHSPAERDAQWGIGTYFMLEDTGALHRLLRWAEQLPTPAGLHPRAVPEPQWAVRRPGLAPAAPDVSMPRLPAEEVVRLAATTLMWTLTSPNRFLRDRATKALVQLLLGFPHVLTGLLDRFLDQDADQVDDPYLFERLVLVAYGVLTRRRAQDTQPELLRTVAQRVLACVYGEAMGPAHASRNALLCDAATRIVQAAHRCGLVSDTEAARTHHPHPCPEPGDVLDDTALDALYPSRGPDEERLWGSLRASLLSLSDFTSYEIRPAVEHFSQLSLTEPVPSAVQPTPPSEDAVQAFKDSLPEQVRDVLGTPEAVQRLLHEHWQARRALDEDQLRLLDACAPVPTVAERLAATTVDKDWAARWITDNAAQRGWSPQKFARFDNEHGHGRSREGHKAERFGKKYQWLGFRELIERLANHRHMATSRVQDFAHYPGAAALLLTDIDPTLPPAGHPLSGLAGEHDQATHSSRYATFPPAQMDGTWHAPAPALPPISQIDDWINNTDDLPDLSRLGVRTIDGVQWVVLNEYATDHAPGRDWSGQAEQWHIQHSWLVAASYTRQVQEFLRDRSLMGRWMPEPATRHRIYLGDFPLPEATSDTQHELRIVNYDTEEGDKPRPTPRARPRRASGTDDAAPSEDVPSTDSASQPENDYAALLHRLTGRGPTRGPEDRLQALQDLAARWSAPPEPQPLEPQARDPHIAYATDGTTLQAVPGVQEYSWESTGHDCSLDSPAGLTLPCAALLAGSDLHRDPDGGNWYTTDGTQVVRALNGYRPTGEVTTLLVQREWLQQRLTSLKVDLVLGLFGERQPRTSNHLRTWREYSQTAALDPRGKPLTATPHITRVRHNRDD